MSSKQHVNWNNHPPCEQQKHVKCALGYNLRQREWAEHSMCLSGLCPLSHCQVRNRKDDPDEDEE